MRVVMISKALVVGAYQRKLEELARLPGVELTAVVPPSWRDNRRGEMALERAFTKGYQLLAAPLVFNGRYHFHFYPALGRILARLKPDVLHVDEEPYNLATWHALRLGSALGARGLFFTWQNLQRRYPAPFRWFERANYRRAAHALAGNQAAERVLRAKGFRGPISVVPQFGVDPGMFAPAAREDGPRADGGPSLVIGYAGALIPEKGVDLLLRACAGLRRGDWQLQILGDGPQQVELAGLAERLGITHKVWFRGRLPSTDVVAAYQAFDLLVLPSRSRPNWIEQFGRVLVEAMACGVPVVGSSCGEIPNVIGDAGLVFAEGDAAALGEAIDALWECPARRADLARRGRARVLERFTQAQVAAATYAVYQKMCAGPAHPAAHAAGPL